MSSKSTYSTPGRRKNGTPYKQVPDGPISDLTMLIQETSPDGWQRRVRAFEELVDQIPEGSLYLNGNMWFNTPKTIAHLHRPVSELLRDARSSVLRRVCTALTKLFRKCQGDAKLLFKELMPTILDVQGQTVQIIRTAVQTMVLDAIPEVPCKSAMPLWMERLKDKSPTIRDACSLYLDRALRSWTEEGYLTDEIWLQVGNCLLRSIRDPSQTVRKHGKAALLHMQVQHPQLFKKLQNDPDGPVAKDPKLRSWLLSLGTEDGEDLSIASKYTLNSDSRFTRNSNLRISTPRLKLSSSMEEDDASVGKPNVPFSIQVTKKKETPRKTGAPPLSHTMANSPSVRGTPPRAPKTSPPKTTPQAKSPQAKTYSALAGTTELEYSESTSNRSDDPLAMALLSQQQSPFIASMAELRQHASRRRSRNSILMQERFRTSTRALVTTPTVDETGKENDGTPLSQQDSPPPTAEHVVIAIRLLRAHKMHVDNIMETLKMEMDTLRDFDRLLEEPGRPTETELLTYYESVDLCLDQRIAAGQELRKEMNRISAGEPPER